MKNIADGHGENKRERERETAAALSAAEGLRPGLPPGRGAQRATTASEAVGLGGRAPEAANGGESGGSKCRVDVMYTTTW